MPQIIVEYTDTLEKQLSIKQLVLDLHETLASQPSIDKTRIKSRAIPVLATCVGESKQSDLLIHITLKLFPRETSLKKSMATALKNAAMLHSVVDCSVTVEVQVLDPDTYTV